MGFLNSEKSIEEMMEEEERMELMTRREEQKALQREAKRRGIDMNHYKDNGGGSRKGFSSGLDWNSLKMKIGDPSGLKGKY